MVRADSAQVKQSLFEEWGLNHGCQPVRSSTPRGFEFGPFSSNTFNKIIGQGQRKWVHYNCKDCLTKRES